MKKLSLLLVLMASFAFLSSCHKMEGDDISSVDSKITEYVLDSTGVLKLRTTSSYDLIIDMLKLYYIEDTSQHQVYRIDAADSIILRNVMVRKGSGIADTVWELKPNTPYKYYAVFQDFMPLVDTIADTLLPWKSMKTMAPNSPERVKTDSAWLSKDTLWLLGTVRSHWRPLVDSIGLTRDLKFVWGTTGTSLDNEVVAQKVKDTLMDAQLEVKFKSFIPKKDFEGIEEVWYKAYVKNAWGDGERYSALDSIPCSKK